MKCPICSEESYICLVDKCPICSASGKRAEIDRIAREFLEEITDRSEDLRVFGVTVYKEPIQ